VRQFQRRFEGWGYVKKINGRHWVTLCKELDRLKLDANSVDIYFDDFDRNYDFDTDNIIGAERVKKETKRYTPLLTAFPHDQYNPLELVVDQMLAGIVMSLRKMGFVFRTETADQNPLFPFLKAISVEDMRFIWPDDCSQSAHDFARWFIVGPDHEWQIPAEGSRTFVSKTFLALAKANTSHLLSGSHTTNSSLTGDRRRCTVVLHLLCFDSRRSGYKFASGGVPIARIHRLRRVATGYIACRHTRHDF